MKLKLLGTAMSALLVTAFLVGRSTTAESSDRDQFDPRKLFPGNYELVSYESFRANGDTVDMGYVGRILYDEFGNMSAIGMTRSFPERAREMENPIRGGFAYFARYEIDPEESRITHHVYGSPTHPDWVETGLVRYYEFDGDLLKLSIRDDTGRTTGTLTWRRFP